MKLILHAPTGAALERARSELQAIARHRTEGIVRLVATGEGAAAAAADRHPDTDYCLVLCADALEAHHQDRPPGVEVVPNGTLLMAKLQRKGWAYVRA